MRKIIYTLIFFISFLKIGASMNGILVQTIDYALQDKWHKTIYGTPIISTTQNIYVGQNLFLSAILVDFEINSNSRADINMEIVIKAPNDSIYYRASISDILKDEITSKSQMFLSDTIVNISFNENDLLGEYDVQVLLSDQVANTSQILESKFNLNQYVYKTQELNMEDFDKWQESYHNNPLPDKAINQFVFFANSKYSDDQSALIPILFMFKEIVDNNMFLQNALGGVFITSKPKERFYLIYLMSLSEINMSDFIETFSIEEKELYLGLSQNQIPDIYAEILDPSQLDILWATFHASGSYKSVLSLIKSLEYRKYKGELDKYTKSEDPDKNNIMAIKNVIYDALVWSLSSNIDNVPLVKYYATWALNHEDLSPVQKDELKAILKKK